MKEMENIKTLRGDIDFQRQAIAKKYNVCGINKRYPIFYYCKIANSDIHRTLDKIQEFKNISKEEYCDLRIYKMLKKLGRI